MTSCIILKSNPPLVSGRLAFPRVSPFLPGSRLFPPVFPTFVLLSTPASRCLFPHFIKRLVGSVLTPLPPPSSRVALLDRNNFIFIFIEKLTSAARFTHPSQFKATAPSQNEVSQVRHGAFCCPRRRPGAVFICQRIWRHSDLTSEGRSCLIPAETHKHSFVPPGVRMS